MRPPFIGVIGMGSGLGLGSGVGVGVGLGTEMSSLGSDTSA